MAHIRRDFRELGALPLSVFGKIPSNGVISGLLENASKEVSEWEGGGEIALPASKNLRVDQPYEMTGNVSLKGHGKGSTYITLADGSNCNMIQRTVTTNRQIKFSSMTLDGNYANNASSNDEMGNAIHIEVLSTDVLGADDSPELTLENLEIRHVARNSLRFKGYSSALPINNIWARNLKMRRARGSHLYATNLTDSHFYDWQMSRAEKRGVYGLGWGNVHLLMLKAFYSGADIAGQDITQSEGFYLNSANRCTLDIEAQENWHHGVNIIGGLLNKGRIKVDRNGQVGAEKSGLILDGTNFNQFAVVSDNFSSSGYWQDLALELKNGSHDNIIDLINRRMVLEAWIEDAACYNNLVRFQGDTSPADSRPKYVSGRYYFSNEAEQAGAALPANSMRFQMFEVTRRVTISELLAKVTTTAATGNFQLAIYHADGLTGLPKGLPVAKTGNMSASVAGVVSGALAANVTLYPGLYWAAINQDGSTAAYLTTQRTPTARLTGSSTLATLGGSANTKIVRFLAQAFGTWPDMTDQSPGESAGPSTDAVIGWKAA